jgi:hypothetical protein
MKGSGRDLTYYHGIYLKGLRKSKKKISFIQSASGRDMNSGLPDYEEGLLMTLP